MDFITVKLYSCFDEMGISPKMLSHKADITRDLGLDSLDVADLVMRLEMAFNIHIPDTDWGEIQTIGDIITYLNRKRVDC